MVGLILTDNLSRSLSGELKLRSFYIILVSLHYRFIRMSPDRFEHLFSLVAPHLPNRKSRFRHVISKEERLVVTLRYLATGDSQQSQSFNFCMGRSTVSNIVKEVSFLILDCAMFWEFVYCWIVLLVLNCCSCMPVKNFRVSCRRNIS